MPDCEFLPKCLYFNDKLKNMPVASELIKTMYCLWHFEECARYMVAIRLGPKNIPSNLFPTDTTQAEKLLAQFNKTQ